MIDEKVEYVSKRNVSELLNEWEALADELWRKSIRLSELKEEYSEKEFGIVYQSDIDFKGLYGSTSEKVRKHHARKELSGLDGRIVSLEVSVDWIKQRIELLKYNVKVME